MPAPMSERKFIKLVREHGYNVQATAKHHEIVDAQGNRLMTFAVFHKACSPRQVKPVYVKQFMSMVGAKDDQEGDDSEDSGDPLE